MEALEFIVHMRYSGRVHSLVRARKVEEIILRQLLVMSLNCSSMYHGDGDGQKSLLNLLVRVVGRCQQYPIAKSVIVKRSMVATVMACRLSMAWRG